MTLVNAFGDIALDQSVQDVKDLLETGARVNPENITTKFREAFESYTSVFHWTESKDANDIIQLDGNAMGSSYLVISKSPLHAGTTSTIETVATFDLPLESAVGLSMSQRSLGQELSMEVVSTEAPLTPPSELVISNISQSTTTLTVNTASAHNLVPGMRIGIYGVVDSRLNYPSLVVASIPSPTQFTCTAGPGGTIPSVTAGAFTSGFVYQRSALGYAKNGMSQIWENATATNSSLYVRANSGDVFPSGTFTTNHSVSTLTTAGTQVSAAFTYAWYPTNEYRMNLQADRVIFYDVAVDATATQNARLLRTQITPDPSKQYKLRFRFTNNKGLTIPTAKIVSATKTASTTATIVTDVAHGLTTSDQIVIYGIRDQTNFANLTTATAVASIVSPTSFTIAFGANVTATSYGGMVSRIQGGNVPVGFSSIAVQTAANDGSFLTLVGSANWGWNIGDYINVYAVRDNSTGADLLVDGAYKVANISTSTMVLQPIGGTTLPAPFSITNCGGTTIRRQDLRINFVRIFDYIRERVEVLNQPAPSSAVPVAVLQSPTQASSQSGTWTVQPGNTANTTPWLVQTSQTPLSLDGQYQGTASFSSAVRSRITVA